ncbi:MAG: formylglycine-generating enzyme family protein [Desulfarculales bacterium]|jgi:formylglycine-generating enzyme required for sulfatase activity|nr:formylglycine-generating enzyme family protein [Desulfarculales bacterium]
MDTLGKILVNSIGMELALIPAGEFMMGADNNFEDAYDDETPRHRVSISKPFYLGKYEVTQGQWTEVTGNNPSRFKGRNNPVETVSWYDAREFIRLLNKREGHSRYRLPTEAEWEYAARAGGEAGFGGRAGQLGTYAWYGANSGDKTHPVGRKRPNAWGLHDMRGNVWEWVRDWYGKNYYRHSSYSDPGGPSSGAYRGRRGGSWNNSAGFCRPAYRGSNSPGYRYADLGFRLALCPE